MSQKKDRVINGTFDDEYNGWTFKSKSINSAYLNQPHQSFGNPDGSVKLMLDNKEKFKGDYGYYEQNITIQEKLSVDKLALLSFDYYSELRIPVNVSAYLAIIIDNVEKNITYDFPTYIQSNSWEKLTLVYDPTVVGQILPGNVTVRVGVYSTGYHSSGGQKGYFSIDNIQFDLWTMPNQMNIVGIQDIEFNSNSNRTYVNSTYGNGYYYNATERTYTANKEIIFTISQNITDIDDFEIETITINVNLLKRINSTIQGLDGSLYTSGVPTTWTTEIIISMPLDYINNRAEILKSSDWNITHIYDGYAIDRIQSCTGTSSGSSKFFIPNGVLSSGLWRIEATSQNYISSGSMGMWNGSIFNNASSITYNDKFQITATLNEALELLLTNTQLNCSIEYPNGTIFWEGTQTSPSLNVKFGNFTVGNNMSVGTYQVKLVWTNNETALYRDKVGFLQFGFNVWHYTNLTAVNDYEEKVSGEPFLMKVNFTDYSSNLYIDFATVTFNSTFGPSGDMIYFGSGIYVVDLDINAFTIGDHYFSFNASKQYYENQSIRNLIHLKIIEQPLALEVPQTVISADANSYAVFQINVTGAISRTPLPGPVNVSTDWQKNFTISDDELGHVTLNLSTDNIPLESIIKTYTVTIFANKT
ncbi:hypothetical protein LCGC14_1259520, partial [marine sediment metagenome]